MLFGAERGRRDLPRGCLRGDPSRNVAWLNAPTKSDLWDGCRVLAFFLRTFFFRTLTRDVDGANDALFDSVTNV
jgi:hypothetical protein